MQLDYIPHTHAYVLKIPRAEGERVRKIMNEHGFDFSRTASTSETAVLMTEEPHAALAFYEIGTPAAQNNLGYMWRQFQSSKALTSNSRYLTPPDQELWPFQTCALDYALARNNALLGQEMGLGKTAAAIVYANEVCRDNPRSRPPRVLVICPANLRRQWEMRIRQWSTFHNPYAIYRIDNARQGVHPSAAWTIVSYDLARIPAVWWALAQGEYDVLIIDEAHYLKNIEAKRTRTVFGGGLDPVADSLASRSRHVLALTGTPLNNRPREAYVLARHLMWDSIDWLSEDAFKHRFNPSNLIIHPISGKRFVDERAGRAGELQARMRCNFMTRHLKREVMTQLQMPEYDLIYVDETRAVKQAIAAEALLDIDPDDIDTGNFELLGHIAEARRIMGEAMAPQIADHIDMLIDGGEEKIVLFYWHKSVGTILEERLNKHGVARIDGGTSSAKRELIKDRFLTDPRCQVLLGNLQAMGAGTDGLQDVAWHVLLAEPDWVPANNEQAIARLDRGGQRNKVHADLFVAPGSVTERILTSSLRKSSVIFNTLDAVYV